MPLIHFKPAIDSKSKHSEQERNELVGPSRMPSGRFISTTTVGVAAGTVGGDAVRQHFVRLPLYKSNLRASVNPGTGKTSEEKLGDVVVASARSHNFWLRRGACFVTQLDN